MKHLMSISLFSLCVWLLTACTQDDGLTVRGDGQEVMLQLPVIAPGMEQTGGNPSTRSAKEDPEKSIKDNKVWVIQFEGTATTSKVKKAKEVTLTNGSVSFPFALTSGKCRVYITANVVPGVTEGVTTLQQFETKVVTYAAATYPLATGTGLPMCVWQDIDPSAVSDASPVPAFKLQAMVAKLILNYTIAADARDDFGSTMTVTLENVIDGAVYKAPTAFAAAAQPSGANFGTKELTKTASTTATYTCTLYVPENIAGQTSGLTSPTQRSVGNAKANATYFKVVALAKSGNNNITVSLFLGDPSNVNDFNVRRNYAYKMDVNVLGIDDADLRLSTKADFMYVNDNTTGWTDASKTNDVFGSSN